MKTIVLAALLAISSNAFAAAPTGAITSLHDLPTVWTGVAGDLFNRAGAEFKLDRVRSETRTPSSLLTIVYNVDATLTIGGRALRIHEITMMIYGRDSMNAELYLRADDDLIKTIALNVVKNDETGRFTAQDSLVNGIRRFSFSGTR